jgi:hypothetical protein
VAPDDQPLDPATWKIVAPAAGTMRPLVVRFPKPLDEALLEEALTVSDAAGRNVTGKVDVIDDEKCWQFTPKRPWQPGLYHLEVATRLEDLAGNRIGRPFEVDVFRYDPRKVKATPVRLTFEIRSAEAPP